MKKLMSLVLLAIIAFTGCSSPVSSQNRDPESSGKEVMVSYAKVPYKTISEMKTARENGSNPWLKDMKKFFYLDQNKVDVQVKGVEAGEFVTYTSYSLKKPEIVFSLQQQQFGDGELAYKNTILRFPKGTEGSLNGTPYHVSRTPEAVVVNMAMDDLLLGLVFPPGVDDSTILELLKSIQSDLLS